MVVRFIVVAEFRVHAITIYQVFSLYPQILGTCDVWDLANPRILADSGFSFVRIDEDDTGVIGDIVCTFCIVTLSRLTEIFSRTFCVGTSVDGL